MAPTSRIHYHKRRFRLRRRTIHWSHYDEARTYDAAPDRRWHEPFGIAAVHLSEAGERIVRRIPVTPTMTGRALDVLLTHNSGVALWAGFAFGTTLVVLSDTLAYFARRYRRGGATLPLS